ncbi:hypothetical protein AHiyo1_50290 [Arthrobacter sp. Hiyo1]|nr:hypothetical protein AHiyo1_50290 [Arthrobacter sp. Hiyo1]
MSRGLTKTHGRRSQDFAAQGDPQRLTVLDLLYPQPKEHNRHVLAQEKIRTEQLNA